MFAEFINEYGTTIIYALVTAIAGYIGIVVKNLYKRYVDDQAKKDVVKTVVQGIEQIYKDLHGEEKLNLAIQNATEMLAVKGITVTDLEIRMLIEAAVGEFNDAFNKETVIEDDADEDDEDFDD